MSYTDERLWATSRWKWRVYRWWRSNRLTILLFLSILAYGCILYLEERDRLEQSRADSYYLSSHLTQGECFFNKQPSSLLIIGDNEETLTRGLALAASKADEERYAWKIAKQTREQKKQPR